MRVQSRGSPTGWRSRTAPVRRARRGARRQDVPGAANFVLLELDRPADEVAATMLARHGVYVRECADKGGRAPTELENRRVAAALRDVLAAQGEAAGQQLHGAPAS